MKNSLKSFQGTTEVGSDRFSSIFRVKLLKSKAYQTFGLTGFTQCSCVTILTRQQKNCISCNKQNASNKQN